MNKFFFSIVTIASLCAITLEVHAQKLEAGSNQIDLGLGAGGRYRVWGAYSGVSPSVYMHFERGLGVDVGPGVLGIGAFAGFKVVGSDYYGYGLNWTYIMFGARAAYHWNDWHNVEQLDVYAGVLAGVNVVLDNNTYNDAFVDPRTDVFRHDTFVGAKWYFSESFGAFAEFGYGVKNAGAGLTFKF